MRRLSRRDFLWGTALSTAAFSARPLWGWPQPSAATLEESHRMLRITEVETHEIVPPYHDYNAATLSRYQGLALQLRTVVIVKTQGGLEGYGEMPGPASAAESFDKYIDTDPFDWINTSGLLAVDMALYDLMGKFLNLPAWKLIGPKHRSWIPVAAWTVSQPPDAMAEEVQSVSRRGFRWLKYHVDESQNVIDQTAAMQKVAPRGFRLHYDFNADSTVESVAPVLRELERFPIAGRVEDPLPATDTAGYRRLMEQCRLSILVHHAPPQFIIDKLCDGYMAGHATIGHAARTAAAAELANVPFMLQQIGGTINLAFLAHEATVFKLATLDHVNLCHLWKDDVTVEKLPVVAGSVRVPDGPGLGVTLDREKLLQYERAPRPKQDRFLVRIRYENGLTIYMRSDPDQPGQGAVHRFLKRHSFAGPPLGYANPVVTDFWDDVDSPMFRDLWERTADGPVWLGDE